MAQTYAQHKEAVDNQYPTPVPVWKLEEAGGSSQVDDVARFETEFNGGKYAFAMYSHINNDQVVWSIKRNGQVVIGSTLTLADCMSQFVSHWNDFCGGQRQHKASHAFALEQLTEAGVSNELSSDTTLRGLAPLMEGVVLTPTFDPETLRYMISINAGRLQLSALRNHDNQVVRWKFGDIYQNGPNGTFRLIRGENVIEVRVTAENTISDRTYIVTVTRVV